LHAEYKKEWKKLHPEYDKNYCKNIRHTAKTIKWIDCPKCNQYGKLRLHTQKNIKTNWVFEFLSVTHYTGHFSARKYDHECYLGGMW
jgi:hypothetical protein